MGLAGCALGSPELGLELELGLGLFPKPPGLARLPPLLACPLTAPAGGGRGKEKEGHVELGPSGVQEQLERGWGRGQAMRAWLSQGRVGWPCFPGHSHGAVSPAREGLAGGGWVGWGLPRL